MRPLVVFSSFLRSAWSFFFRWPCTHTDNFRAESLFIGPFLQAGVALAGCLLCWMLATSGGPEIFFEGHLFLGVLGLSILTGFFHEDGLADTADGFGPAHIKDDPKSRDKIALAMKDSRLGTYGVCALIFLWLFRYELLWDTNQDLRDFFLALLWSRSVGLGVGAFLLQSQSGVSGHSLGALSLPTKLIWATALAIASLLAIHLPSAQLGSEPLLISPVISAPLFGIFAAGILQTAILLIWFRKRAGFLNGDHIGAVICINEIFFLFNFESLH